MHRVSFECPPQLFGFFKRKIFPKYLKIAAIEAQAENFATHACINYPTSIVFASFWQACKNIYMASKHPPRHEPLVMWKLHSRASRKNRCQRSRAASPPIVSQLVHTADDVSRRAIHTRGLIKQKKSIDGWKLRRFNGLFCLML